MDFLEMLIKLKMLYQNQIILISCGAFYIAVAEGAVLLNKKIGLKVICIARNMCKVGTPVY